VQDNVSVIVATIMAVVIIVLFPIYNIANRNDNVAKNIAVELTTNFVDEIRNKGYITKEQYGNFLNKLSATGNQYEVEMEVHKPLLLQAENMDEYEEDYEIDYTDTILAEMDNATTSEEKDNSIIKNQVYYLKEGYKIYVRVKNTNITQAQILMGRLFGGNSDKERIVINYGGVVYSNEWAQSKNAETVGAKLKISRPINMKTNSEYKYERIIGIQDEITGKIKTIFGIAVRLSDKENNNTFGFRVTYTDVEFLKADGANMSKAERIQKVKNSFKTVGFTVSDKDEYGVTTKGITVEEKVTDVANGNYEYFVTLANIDYDENAPYVTGYVYIEEGSATSEAGPLSRVNSKEFILVYSRKRTPYIPEGFVRSIYEGEKEVEDGMVIYETNSLVGVSQSTAQTTYNQFVWIPVEDIVEFSMLDRSNLYMGNGAVGYGTVTAVEPVTTNEDEVNEYNMIIASIIKYGGFYASRYEASLQGTKIVSKKGKTALNMQSWYNARDYCRNMYSDNEDIKSNLTYGIQWDTILTFLSDSGYNISDSRSWGYINCTYSGYATGARIANNLYDVAGNYCEWTMESASVNRIHRGGSYHSGWPSNCWGANMFCLNSPSRGYSDSSFRPCLYLTKDITLSSVEGETPSTDRKDPISQGDLYLPEGFSFSIYNGEKNVNDGIVIYQTNSLEGVSHEDAMKLYNQFVWIPVDNIDNFVRSNWVNNDWGTMLITEGEPASKIMSGGFEMLLSSTNDNTGEVSEYSNMLRSVKSYGGFYISRYEAGINTEDNVEIPEPEVPEEIPDTELPEEGTEENEEEQIDSEEQTTPEEPEEVVEIVIDENEVVSKKMATVRSSVKWGNDMGAIGTTGAVYMARNMVGSNAKAVSTLCYDVQWDAVLDFVKSVKSVTSSSSWGNSGNVQKSGSSESYKAKNIYDLAGNVIEWTMAANDMTTRILRGTASNASARVNKAPSNTEGINGFRVALYLR